MSDTGASRVVLITWFRLTAHALHACNFIRGMFGWGGQTTIDRTWGIALRIACMAGAFRVGGCTGTATGV
jgi:hypothetical protein